MKRVESSRVRDAIARGEFKASGTPGAGAEAPEPVPIRREVPVEEAQFPGVETEDAHRTVTRVAPTGNSNPGKVRSGGLEKLKGDVQKAEAEVRLLDSTIANLKRRCPELYQEVLQEFPLAPLELPGSTFQAQGRTFLGMQLTRLRSLRGGRNAFAKVFRQRYGQMEEAPSLS
jgi:hypothetical protein